MERLLLGLDIANPSMDDLNAIFRAAHSIKGGAGTFGFTDMIEVTHVLETLLDQLRKQERSLTNEMVNAFLEAGDAIAMQLAGHRDSTEVDQEVVAKARATLERLSSPQEETQPATKSKSKKAAKAVAVKPEAEAYGFFDAERADPSELGYGFFDDEPAGVTLGKENTEAKEDYGFFVETPVQKSERENNQGFGFFQEPKSDANLVPEAAPPATKSAPAQTAAPLVAEQAHPTRRAADKTPPPSTADSSIRVSIEKVDQLINLVGELVITQAMLTQSASQLDPEVVERLQNGLNQLERNTRDIQESVMAVRMLPISFVFSRFPRVVRDMAAKLNKQIELKTLGEGTELDKGLI
jgi:two-component system chemotaxis sensor kinase CheA